MSKKNPDKGVVVLTGDALDLADYWQRKKGFKTRKAFIEATIRRYVTIENHDYQLPVAEIQRLNQLISANKTLADEIHLTREAVNNGFQTILNLDDDNDI